MASNPALIPMIVRKIFKEKTSTVTSMNDFNNRFLRERGMASNPIMEYQVFLCIFQKNSAMAILGLKEMGKFLLEFLFCPFGCLSLVLLKRKVAEAEFIWKMQRKTWYSISGVDAMPLFLKNLLLSSFGLKFAPYPLLDFKPSYGPDKAHEPSRPGSPHSL